MTLTGPQAKQIQDVLLTSYDTAKLARMVQFQLGETLEQIAGGTDLTEIVFNLVQWADRNGRVLDLIDGALAANPDHPQLQELQIEASGWHLAPPEEGEPPYQGLQYFDVDDTDRFFGRENLTAELVGYLRDHRLLAVIGASGSGKSSVVCAGVVPALASGAALDDGTLPPRGSADWLVHILTPTARPLKALSASLTKGSEFVMGSTQAEIAQLKQNKYDASHEISQSVSVDGFWIMHTEVTNAQYARCVKEGPCNDVQDDENEPARKPGYTVPELALRPITEISWQDAMTYASWVGGTLPTEAQWEFACRGTDGHVYPWSNDAPSTDLLNYASSDINGTVDVGTYPSGANGLYDMAGNVWEWTSDWYQSVYSANSPDSHPRQQASSEVRPFTIRGGAWDNHEFDVRCAVRGQMKPDGIYYVGFRVISPGAVGH